MHFLPWPYLALVSSLALANVAAAQQKNPPIPAWVRGVTRMAFVTPGQVDEAARHGVQVAHGNAVWPYFPLRRDGGGLDAKDAQLLRDFVERCHRNKMKLVLGLPPFPSVELAKRHPDWRVQPDDSGKVLKLEPREDNLGTRLGCNLGPWGDYLIDVCVELVKDYQVDGYSFDGNYHPPICHCPHCKKAYRDERQRDIPPKINLDDVAYREYLVWRGERLEDHYLRLKRALRKANPDAVLMSWTVNAGRYGHFLHSPRAMPTSLNRIFDLPMQEWWLDETNLGASVAPAFGAAYLSATVGYGPNASEPYLMSRGNPYGTDSFPKHERITRSLLAMTHGSQAALSLGWPGPKGATQETFAAIAERESWLTNVKPLPWAALLVSEQTRQFYAYKDIPDRFLAHQFGVFRCAMEQHLPLTLINDWDVTAKELSRFKVVILANTAALSDQQVAVLRKYVNQGGGLVATTETSLFDELGRPRGDFALRDLFGVSYQGRPKAPLKRPELDENFAITVDENYWKQRTGVARLTWTDHELTRDQRLDDLVPGKNVIVRGPLVKVSEPADAKAVVARLHPEGEGKLEAPGIVARSFGKGRVIFLAAGIDHALWSYAYPYQRILLARAIQWAAGERPPIRIEAPMCVQTTFYEQPLGPTRRLVLHFFNGINTTAQHGLPAVAVPLREETAPIHDIRVRLPADANMKASIVPTGRKVQVERANGSSIVTLPPLERHLILLVEPFPPAGVIPGKAEQ